MLDLIFSNMNSKINAKIEWKLSPAYDPDSYYWEKLHITNVEQDVNIAFNQM
jgi:hypothetical protein